MSRPLRINFEGAYYHVMNRGRGRSDIYHDEKDYRKFLYILKETCRQYKVRVIAYCLMSNHYHLVLFTPDVNLSHFMRQINGIYTRNYNQRYKTDGSLFRGRYKAHVVQEEFYLIRVVRYTHLNPVKAGIVKKPEKYKWSSHHIYLTQKEEKLWLTFVGLIEGVWGKGAKGFRAYVGFMKKKDDRELEAFYALKNQPSVLGEKGYVDEIKQNYIFAQRYEGEIPERRRLEDERKITAIELLVREEFKMGGSELKAARRGKENMARNMAIKLIRDLTGVGLKRIAKMYRIGNERGVSEYCRRVQSRCKRDVDYNKRYERLLKTCLQVET